MEYKRIKHLCLTAGGWYGEKFQLLSTPQNLPNGSVNPNKWVHLVSSRNLPFGGVWLHLCSSTTRTMSSGHCLSKLSQGCSYSPVPGSRPWPQTQHVQLVSWLLAARLWGFTLRLSHSSNLCLLFYGSPLTTSQVICLTVWAVPRPTPLMQTCCSLFKCVQRNSLSLG